jgi:hypothetical protein
MVKYPLIIQIAQGQPVHSATFYNYANRLYRQSLFITAIADDEDAEDYKSGIEVAYSLFWFYTFDIQLNSFLEYESLVIQHGWRTGTKSGAFQMDISVIKLRTWIEAS